MKIALATSSCGTFKGERFCIVAFVHPWQVQHLSSHHIYSLRMLPFTRNEEASWPGWRGYASQASHNDHSVLLVSLAESHLSGTVVPRCVGGHGIELEGRVFGVRRRANVPERSNGQAF